MFRLEGNTRTKNADRAHGSDKILIIIMLVILVFGIISLSSASSVTSYNKYNDAYYFVKLQLRGLIMGIVAFVILMNINYHQWKKYSFGFLIFSIFLLTLVFIPGLSRNYGKANSWINIFGFSLQPSEFVKLSFLIYLAAWLEAKKENLKEFTQGIVPFLAVLGIIGALMLLQPDIGTLSIIAATSLIVYFVGGGSKKYIFYILLIGLTAFTVMVSLWAYQSSRFKCVFNTDSDRQGKCYQTNQSLIAVGSGGIFGRGLGASRQKFMYVPEVQGDSIFAIIAEENGLIVCILLLLCYVILFYRGYMISRNASDGFGRILAIGIVVWLALQTVLNIGGIINLIPMTGVPLPLISYGGSSILTALASIGILVNISKYTKN